MEMHTGPRQTGNPVTTWLFLYTQQKMAIIGAYVHSTFDEARPTEELSLKVPKNATFEAVHSWKAGEGKPRYSQRTGQGNKSLPTVSGSQQNETFGSAPHRRLGSCDGGKTFLETKVRSVALLTGRQTKGRRRGEVRTEVEGRQLPSQCAT